MTSNRPEFVVAVIGASKLGAAAVLLNPAWKALEVATALDLTAPGYGVADGPAVSLLAERLGGDRVLDLDGGDAATAFDRASDIAAAGLTGRRGRRIGPRIQLGHDRPAQGGSPHPPLHRAGDVALVPRARVSATTTASRSPRPPRTSWAC